jgi:Phage Mu protein F like protein.
VQSASERGNLSAMQDAPGVVGKRWNTTLDGRARRTHRDADGQIAPIDGQFDVGGSTLRHPGDPTAELEEIANCRCFSSPVFESDLTDEELAELQAGNIIYT